MTPTAAPTVTAASWSHKPVSSKSLSTGATIGLVIGAVSAISLLTGLVIFLLRRYSRKNQRSERRSHRGPPTVMSGSGTAVTSGRRRIASWSANVGAPSIQESFTKEAEGSSPVYTEKARPAKIYPGFEDRFAWPAPQQPRQELHSTHLVEIGDKSDRFSGSQRSTVRDKTSPSVPPKRKEELGQQRLSGNSPISPGKSPVSPEKSSVSPGKSPISPASSRRR